MSQKIALITGASSDIGQEVTRILAVNGYNIVAHYHNNKKRIDEVKKAVKDSDSVIKEFCCDLTKHKEANKLIEYTIREFGKVDLLINMIGPFYYRDILEVDPIQWSEAVDLNLNVNFFVTHYAIKDLIKSKGHIIFFGFSGAHNFKAWPMSADYCAAKSGIVVLTKTLATRLAPEGVRVNAVCPGLIEVGETSLKERKNMAKQVPFGRPGTPAEVAEVLRWLVIDSPEYVTGSLVSVSGAWEY